MSSEQARELRQRGIAAAKAGQNDQARQLLQQSIRLEPQSEAAWIWMASLARDRRERLFCFQKILQIDPNNETALKALQAMGITREQLLGTSPLTAPAESSAATPAAPPRAATPRAPQAAQPQPTNPQTPGVPLPDAQSVAAAQAQVDEILRDYRLAATKIDNVTWVQKTSKRAGERDNLYLRLYIGGAIAGILVVFAIIGGIILATNPEAQAVVFGASATPSFTPSLTPTNTPGFTPTPSPTPQITSTPSPTVPVSITPGRIDAVSVPTQIYPEVSSRFVSDAVSLINNGQFAVALPTLVRERESTEFSFNPGPYYYEALAMLEADNPQDALSRIQEAESRLGETPNQNYKPLVDVGFAQVFYYLAQEAFQINDVQQGRGYLEQLEIRARAAIEGDPRIPDAYVLLARRFELVQRYSDALTVLNDGLRLPELETNTSLIVERGEVYFAQDEIPEAGQQAFLALYIDPTIEDAYLLQIKAALAQDDPGLAVIYAQNYLFFYPGSVAGYKLLGDARVAEVNIDLALTAYDQALAAEDMTDATVDTLLARAELYDRQGRYTLARSDLTRAFNLTDNPAIQARRMQVAYSAGNYATALEDADALTGTGVIDDSQIQLIRARILIDEATGTNDYTQALDLLNNVNLPLDQQPIVDEYRARAQANLNDFNGALNSIDAALAGGETGSRRYLRGTILEGLQLDTEALREYEWVLTWSQIYPYPFLPDAQSRYDALSIGS